MPAGPGDAPAALPAEAGAGRLARAWAAGLAALTLAGSLAAGLRLAAVSFGFLLTDHERRALLIVLAVHLSAAAGFLLLRRLVSTRPDASRRMLRVLALTTPLLMLALVDRWLAVAIAPPISSTNLYVLDEELGWKHRPTCTDWADPRVRINARGCRGPETSYEKRADEFRVLLLGDSVAFGPGVAYEDTFPALLHADLAVNPAGRRVTVINTAVSGYSPWQELVLLKREGFRYEPDMVVQCFCLNDIAGKFELVQFGGDRVARQAATAASDFEWSGVYRLIRLLRLRGAPTTDEGAPRTAKVTDEEIFARPDAPAVRQAWSEVLAELGTMAELCAARQTPFAVVIFPFNRQLQPAPDGPPPQEELVRYCQASGIPCLDLRGPFRQWLADNSWQQRLLFDWAHLSEAGHGLAAEHIRAFLQERGLFASLQATGPHP